MDKKQAIIEALIKLRRQKNKAVNPADYAKGFTDCWNILETYIPGEENITLTKADIEHILKDG